MDKKAASFEFVGYHLDQTEVTLNYAIHYSDGTISKFTEIYMLPDSVYLSEEEKNGVLDSVLHTLHLMSGLSYWKLYCPSTIIIKTKPLTKEQAFFWNEVYTKGLGEFYYKNKVDFRDLVNFPYQEDLPTKAFSLKTDEKVIMGVGGGKDSLVSYELLKKASVSVTALLLETQKEYPLINDVVEVMKVGSLHFRRKIDQQLFDQSTFVGSYNGHVPITALYSVVGLLCAALYGYRYIVMSNEKSASYGNVQYLGSEINHQWSKSEEFEKLFQTYIQSYITTDITYFSLLRPWSEVKIVQEFIKHPQYFSIFSSCNNNFKIYKQSGISGENRWCGNCPKCAFVFAILSGYLPKNDLITIFGKNLYANNTLLPVFKELLGVKDYKPFECVGTPQEVQLVFYKAYKKGEYNEDIVMQMFISEVLPQMIDAESLEKDVMSLGTVALIPDKFRALVT